MFRVSVRSSVRPSVRKVITFYEADMRGSQVPEDSRVLKIGFFRNEKKWSKFTYPWQMLPVLDQLLGTFFEHLKNMYLTWIASVDKKLQISEN